MLGGVLGALQKKTTEIRSLLQTLGAFFQIFAQIGVVGADLCVRPF